MSYLFADYQVFCEDALDVDDSGSITSTENNVINLSDVIYLLNYLFKHAEPPPPPFKDPECGEDPTLDLISCEAYPPCVP